MIYAIGDIHGQVTMLRALLDKLYALPLHDEDTLVFIGDYIDRGEDSKAVIETLIQLKRERTDTVFLRGNHEQLMLDARSGPPPQPSPAEGFVLHSEPTIHWIESGGAHTLHNYDIQDYLHWWESIPEAHWQFIQETQLEYITPRYHFVHAGLLPPGETWWETDRTDVDPRLWIREQFLRSEADFAGRIVVFGHSPQMSGKPLLQPNKIGIDTGAAFGGMLTCAVFAPNAKQPDLAPPHFYQVEYVVA